MMTPLNMKTPAIRLDNDDLSQWLLGWTMMTPLNMKTPARVGSDELVK